MNSPLPTFKMSNILFYSPTDNLELSESTDKAIFDMFQILESAEAQSAASELGNAPAVTGDGQGDITSSRSDEFTQLVNNCDGHPATADIEDQNTLTAAARHGTQSFVIQNNR